MRHEWSILTAFTPLFFASGSFFNDHLVAALGAFGPWLTGSFTLSLPTPDRHRVLI